MSQLFFTLSESQRNKVFQLMEMMGLDSIDLSLTILQMSNWNVQDAISTCLGDVNVPTYAPPAPPVFQRQPSYDVEQENQNEVNQLMNQQEDEINRIKKQSFDLQFPSLNLKSQVSDLGPQIKKEFSVDIPKIDRLQQQKFKKYYLKLIEKDQSIKAKLQISHNQIEQNKQFVKFLNQSFNKNLFINFSFGNFASNAILSLFRNKPMLVYVHKGKIEKNNPLCQLVRQEKLINCINSNFVVYGMFDNSDDYQILQQELKMFYLPGFIAYSYDKTSNKARILGTFSLSTYNRDRFYDYLNHMIQQFKKAPVSQKQQIKQKIQQTKLNLPNIPLNNKSSIVIAREIKYEQDEEYRRLEKEYLVKRQISNANKENREKINQLRKLAAQEFLADPTENYLEILFRLPFTGKSNIKKFSNADNVERLFKYVWAHCYEEFENQNSEFDLIQTYPPLSLKDNKSKTIGQIFEGSPRQNLIIKQF